MLEPHSDGAPWQPREQEATAALVPALAATRDGVRLGRGGGYYDRFLGKNRAHIHKAICILPDFAVLEEIPNEAHDVQVDVVLSIKN